MSYSDGRPMNNQDSTLMSAVQRFRTHYKDDPACFTRSDLNDLDALIRHTSQLLGAAYRGQMNDERHWESFDRARDLCKKLEKKYSDYERKQQWEQEYLRQQRQEKFNPYHVPAGSPDGGQFDFAPGSGEGSGGGGNAETPRIPRGTGDRQTGVSAGNQPAGGSSPIPKPFNAHAAAQHAIRNVADPVAHPYGNQRCGVKVREAAAAGLSFHIPKKDWEASAKDQGRMYTKYGFKVETSSSAGGGYPPKGYHPQVGDIAVIQPIPGHLDGHAAIYTGKDTGWYSDFKQSRDIWPHRDYEKVKPTYTIYRHPSLAD